VVSVPRRPQRIKAVATASGPIEADIFVLAAGCNSPDLATTAGVRLPIFAMKGFSATLPASSGSPRLSITETRERRSCFADSTVEFAWPAWQTLDAAMSLSSQIEYTR